MEVADVGPALQERLGPEATEALVDLFDVARREWTADVTTAAVERFERRLSDEMGGLRAEIRTVDTNLRLEIAGLRQDMTSEFGAVRQEMAGLRQELKGDIAGLRQELKSDIGILAQDNLRGRVELLKWCFAFWFGQIIAVATVVGVMLRMMQT